MIGLILRVLPWYVREPLAISMCLTLSGASFYWTVQDGGWARFGFGVLFLAIAVLRGFILRGELRSWRAGRQPTTQPKSAEAAQ
ncbi:hypothetical protein ACKI1I_17890 [Streptomyces turgidiscabies]|uniref:Uncharacterized protein n=1 Tax=Streptomyces turgidiscabies (strain Car8) TaxID=698760 RepID=L7FH18_STRT8|nr:MULTISPECIES: hypothetical protein [Streptomyces]ELP69990.1 hypothetical protein STRTUCAR8_07120 [Streptomyces turgidiscabies Car8]MDX3498010.1 hypothetical protein [Streptomyces turgidiscabies]GAQ69919.1 hypothetical protein T45_01650 [Streptomyces turgidiscabies]